MTRFLLVVNFEGGVVETPMEEWKPEEIETHLDYHRALRKPRPTPPRWRVPAARGWQALNVPTGVEDLLRELASARSLDDTETSTPPRTRFRRRCSRPR